MFLSDYKESVKQDAIEFIDENYSYYNDFGDLFDHLELSVTGNDNGSYYCNSYAAKEALKDIIFDNEFHELLDYSDLRNGFYHYINENDPESADVIARIIILWDMYDDIKDYWEENYNG